MNSEFLNAMKTLKRICNSVLDCTVCESKVYCDKMATSPHSWEIDNPILDSIKHWEENLALAQKGEFDKININGTACALCTEHIASGCGTCPVRMRTGKTSCEGSPYEQVKQEMQIIRACKESFVKYL